MKPITVWERWYSNPGRFEHNHIEDGHSHRDTPKAITQDQFKAWVNADGWRITFCYLDSGNVVQEN